MKREGPLKLLFEFYGCGLVLVCEATSIGGREYVL